MWTFGRKSYERREMSYRKYDLYAEEVLVRFADGQDVAMSTLLWAIKAIKHDREKAS